MKKTTTKVFISFITLLTLAFGLFGIEKIFTHLNQDLIPASTNYQGVIFSVDKINRFAGSSLYGTDPNSASYFSSGDGSTAVTEEIIFPITKDDQAVMLNNAELESSIEAVKISLLPDENYIVWLSPTIKLNGIPIDCSGDGGADYGINTGTIKYNDPATTDDCYKFIFYIDLTNVRNAETQELISDTNGYYEISLNYHYKFSSSQTTSSINQIDFGLYILDEVDFINSNSEATASSLTNPRDNVDSTNAVLNDTTVKNLDKNHAFQAYYNNNKTYVYNGEEKIAYRREHVEPRLYNTERIDRYIISNSSEPGNMNYYVNYKPANNVATNTEDAELNFFNYNNQATTDYDGNLSRTNSELLFPQYTYDASKYNISWTYTYKSSEKYTVTSSFSINGNTGTVIFRKNNEVFFTASAQNNNGMYIVTIPFTEIGEYVFTVRYTVREYIVGKVTTESRLTNNYIVIDSLSDKIKTYDSTGTVNYVNRQKEYLVGEVQLSIFGYELYYTDEDDISIDSSDNSTTYKLSKFKNTTGEYKYITDYTFLNDQRMVEEKANRVTIESADNTDKVNAYNNIYNLRVVNDEHITKAELTPINLGTYTTISSTNQAPVEFKYLGTYACETEKTNYSYSYYIYYPYGKNNLNGVSLSQVTNSTRFTSNGTYDVVVLYTYTKYMHYNYTEDASGVRNYDYTIQGASDSVHVQVFTFEIANTPPKMNIVDENGTTLNKGDYTNKSVTITIEKSNSPFNVQPVLSCDYTDYDTMKTSAIKLTEIESGVYQATATGNYAITVRYGQGRKSLQKTEFNIDKTPIANPILYNQNGSQMTSNLTSNNFYLSYREKASGAPITVTYLYMPIDKLANLNVSDIFAVANNESIIKNGYYIYQIFEDSSTYKKDAIINVPGFYLFTLKDKAGNIGYKFAFYDTTSPLILQKELIDGNTYTDWYLATYMNNIVTTKTIVHWGTTKAIMLDNSVMAYLGVVKQKLESYSNVLTTYANTLSSNTQKALYNNSADLTNFYNTFCINNSAIRTYAQIPLSHIKIIFSGTTISVIDLPSPSAIANRQEATFYTVREDSATDSNLIASESSTSVRLYQITSEDNLGNYRNALLEVNLDNSLVLIYSHSSTQVKYEENNEIISVNYLRLYNQEVDPTNYGTNRSSLYITFKNGIGKYEIESLSYSFYALDLSKTGSQRFPYSNVSSITDYTYDLSTARIHSGTNGLSDKNNLILGPLNASSNNITTAGIYVVKRVYVGGENDYLDTGDTKEKIYTFLVDRTGIITILDGTIIGEFITLGLGANNKQSVLSADVTVSGTEFLVSVGSGETLFTTNIVPIFYFLPENKYYFSNSLYSTLVPLNLNIKVYYDPYSFRFDDSTLQDNNFVIYKEGNYKIVISDTTGFNTSTTTNNDANSFEFIFTIEYKKPEGYYTKIIESSDGSDLETEISNEITSVNSKTLSFYWTDPLTKFDAEIDPTKVTVMSYPTNGGGASTIYSYSTQSTSKVKFSTEVVSISGKTVTKYILNLDYYAQIEARYVVHLEYKGTSSTYIANNPNFKNDIVIYVDTTSPNYNANILVAKDQYLSIAEKQNMIESILHTYREENGSQYYINFENYVFVVDETFTLSSMVNDRFWLTQHDTYSAYIRKYSRDMRDNATSDGSVLQSLIPSDPHYNEANYSTQYKFSPLLKSQGYNVYTEIKYDEKISLIEEYGQGYYEIIEVDEAGNATIYTIYVQPKNTVIYDMYYTSEDGRTYQTSALQNYELNDKNIEMTFSQITSKVDWFKLNMYDSIRNNSVTIEKTYNKKSLDEGEYNSLDEILEYIRNFTYLTEEMKVSGASFRFTFYHPSNTNLNYVVVYNTPGELVDLKFEVVKYPTTTIIVTVPAKTHTYIKSIDIYQGGTDASGNSISSYYATFIPSYTTNGLSYNISASSGISYLFKCTDNFDRVYYKIKNVDIIDAGELVFSGPTARVDGVTFTSSSVSLRYQSKLYKLSIEVDGIEINSTEYGSMFTITNEGDGIYNIQLVQTNPSINLDRYYCAYLTPILQPDSSVDYEVQPLAFRLYTVLPELNLYTSAGKSLDYAINGSTAKDIYIYYSNAGILFDVTVSATCIDEEGRLRSYPDLKTGNALTVNGTYTIRVANSLGASYSFTVTKKVNSDPYFTVYKHNHTSEEEKLQMSTTKYSTMIGSNAAYLDWYFSTFDRADLTTLDVDIMMNEDLNIIVDNEVMVYEETIDNVVFYTKIYYIHTNTTDPDKLVYQKYIAVTFVDASNSLLDSFMAQDATREDSTPKTITSASSSINTSLSVTFIEEKVRITWTPYFEIPQNLISVVYYYNGVRAGVAYDGVQGITLIETGVYQLEFYDFAGNRHLFGTNSATSSYMYQITMYNSIMFTLNDEDPIDNRVYNGPVTLKVLDTESLKTNTLRYTATYNGESLILSRTLTEHTLSDFGYYEIQINADIEYTGRFISLSDENEKTIASLVSKISFTILNPDQARYAYTYSGNTIYAVYFNGKNVTTDALNGLNQATNIVLSPETIGYGGIFTIYAKKVYDGLRPDGYFDFKVWINNESPIIRSNIENGGSTTKELYIYFNPYIIYNQVGVCDLVITRSDGVIKTYAIDPANNGIEGEIQIENETYTIYLDEIGTYIIQVQINGNTLSSFVVTKAEKLNTVAIIVIALVVLATIIGGAVFIKLRTRMKVK